MEDICKFNKFGYCKYKNKCEKDHVREQCKDGQNCESVKSCTLRHPKMCKRITLEGLCRFGEKCAYSHQRISNFPSLEHENVHEDVKVLKAEVNSLKKALKSLIDIREESEELKRAVIDIKEDIKFLDSSNREVVKRIINLEKNPTGDLKDKSENYCETILVKKADESHTQESAEDLKCVKCEYIGQTNVSLKKHINTKNLKFRCDQCDCTFKKEITLKKHKNTKHGQLNKKLGEGKFGYFFDVRPGKEYEAEILREEWKTKEVEEHISRRDTNSSLSDIEADDNYDDSEDDDAFLAKYDEDGNFIG
jgi:uncharacterized C2H2 Zn-finger protein